MTCIKIPNYRHNRHIVTKIPNYRHNRHKTRKSYSTKTDRHKKAQLVRLGFTRKLRGFSHPPLLYGLDVSPDLQALLMSSVISRFSRAAVVRSCLPTSWISATLHFAECMVSFLSKNWTSPSSSSLKVWGVFISPPAIQLFLRL